MVAQLSLPDAPAADELVTITSEALVAASYLWAEKKCFGLAMWLMEISDAAKLDAVPLRLPRSLAVQLELMNT